MDPCTEHEGGRVLTANPSDVDVGSVAQVPPGSTAAVETADSDLMLANVDGTIVALAGPCLRCGSSLASGALRHAVLTCLHCGWQYDLEQGAVIGLPALKLRRHAVRLEGDRMFLPATLFEERPSEFR